MLILVSTSLKYSVFHALSEEGNREDQEKEGENDYEEGESNEDEPSKNDTDEESTQHAGDADQDFYCFTRERWNKTNLKKLCQNT